MFLFENVFNDSRLRHQRGGGERHLFFVEKQFLFVSLMSCFVMFHVCSLLPCGHLQGKG